MRKQMIVGIIATAVIVIALPIYAWRESSRMETARQELREEAIAAAMPLYAENCAVCHGAAGEGVGAYPPLDSEALRTMEYDTLFKTIERGRYDTAMAPYGVEEGGMLNDAQIDQLIALIYYGDWGDTAEVVAEMGLTPPRPAASTVSTETLQLVAGLPEGEALVHGLTLYAENCVACHGADGGGTSLGPALNTAEMRERLTDDDLARIIAQGVPGTLMAGWDNALTERDIADLVTTLRRWDSLPAAAIPAPAAPPVIAVSDPDVVAWGGQIYAATCAHCHGSEGQGRPIAPALNVQGFLGETNDLAIKTIIAQGVPDTAMPAWGDRLGDEELNALVSFIRAWEPTAPVVAEMERGRPAGRGGPPWMRGEGGIAPPPGQGGTAAPVGATATPTPTASAGLLAQVNWRPLIFFGISGIALVALVLVLTGGREETQEEPGSR